MKKFLALVLALVMTMSLVTISAGADFADEADIKYDEAVAVMNAAGIVGGSGGSFYPNSTLSRGAAAKIIAIMVLGADGAAKLDSNAAPFSDVPAGSTFAPYISWAVEKGYVGGYPDGTYRPSNTLSGYAWLKILLCALGYDATIENYGGSNMGANVAEDAMARGLLTGISGFVGSNNVTREEACQMALNTLKATRVKYDNPGTKITTSDGTEIVVGASAASLVTDGAVDLFRDVYQPKLVPGGTTEDKFGRPATEWIYDKVSVGVFPKAPTVSYTKQFSANDLYVDAGLKANITDTSKVTAYVDGKDDNASEVAITKGAKDTKFGGAGTLTDVYYDEDAGTVILVQVNTYLAKITNVKTVDEKRVIVLGTEGNFECDEFAKGDYVLYTQDDNGSANAVVQSVAAAEKLTGKLTKKVGTTLTIDGKEYTVAAAHTGDVSGTIGKNVEFYLDSYGYVINLADVSAAEVDVSDLAILEEANNARGDYAVLRFADGSKKTVETDQNYYGLTDGKYYIVSFEVNDDGDYKLTDKALIANNVDFKGAGSKFDNTKPVMGGQTVNNKTNFLVKVTDTGNSNKVTYETYVGYKNVPSFEADSDSATTFGYILDAETNVAIFCYVEIEANDKTVAASKLMTVIAYDPATKLVEEEKNDYYEVNAVIDGEATVVKVDDDASELLTSLSGYALYASYTMNSKGVITAASRPESGDRDWAETIEVLDGTIVLGSNKYSYAEDLVVYAIDDEYAITEGDIDSIETDSDNDSIGEDPYSAIEVALKDGVITTIVLWVK